jgi:hypothetical protein
MEMHDGNDYNEVWSDSKKDAEWEGFREAAPHVEFNNRIEVWIELDLVESLLNAGQVTLAQAGLLGLVPRCRIDHFQFSFGVEADRCHPKAA